VENEASAEREVSCVDYDDLKKEADQEQAGRSAARVSATSPSLPLARYAGSSSDPLHGEIRVTQEGGGLRLHYGSAFVGPLEHWHDDTFRAKRDAAWRQPELVTFVLDAEGKPGAIEMTGTRFARVPDGKESPRQD
jgi:hypothetical protein